MRVDWIDNTPADKTHTTRLQGYATQSLQQLFSQLQNSSSGGQQQQQQPIQQPATIVRDNSSSSSSSSSSQQQNNMTVEETYREADERRVAAEPPEPMSSAVTSKPRQCELQKLQCLKSTKLLDSVQSERLKQMMPTTRDQEWMICETPDNGNCFIYAMYYALLQQQHPTPTLNNKPLSLQSLIDTVRNKWLPERITSENGIQIRDEYVVSNNKSYAYHIRSQDMLKTTVASDDHRLNSHDIYWVAQKFNREQQQRQPPGKMVNIVELNDDPTNDVWPIVRLVSAIPGDIAERIHILILKRPPNRVDVNMKRPQRLDDYNRNPQYDLVYNARLPCGSYTWQELPAALQRYYINNK